MKKGSRRVKSKSLFARLLGNSKGTVAVYVGLVSPVLVGLGSLTIDLGRLMSLNIELQSAADAASLACARELDRTTGSQARCRAAAVNAVQNMETFAADGFAATDIISADICDNTTPVAPCIRILKDLPANDTDPITAANVAASDDEARFGEIFTRARQVNNIMIRLATFGQAAGFSSTNAHAVAGQNQTVCRVPPMFMCNPSETAGNTNEELAVDVSALQGRQINMFQQGGSGAYSPGNFGLLCPIGASNCGGNAVKEALASAAGSCFAREGVDTKTGVTLGPVRAGINVRFDYWTSQTKGIGSDNNAAWRSSSKFTPSPNVTSGRTPPNNPTSGSAKCEPSLTDANDGSKLPRDACLIAGNCGTVANNYHANPRIGNSMPGAPTWNYRSYFRINHGCDVTDSAEAAGSNNCKPADWDAVTNAPSKGPAAWPPTRFDTYRYEIEKPVLPAGIVAAGATISACTVGDPACATASLPASTTEENGTTSATLGYGCFDPENSLPEPVKLYDWHANDRVSDSSLLLDRRVMPIAIANCIALEANGKKVNGKFTFRPSEFVYVFMTEPVPAPSDSTIHAEMIGKLDDVAMNQLTHDVVQLYRRR